MVAFPSDVLSRLCSKDQLALLDSIDRLRLQGINNYISLPQIVVCGDQSSGKSSVLEAISGVSFPIKGNLCTRFPTEVVLRRTPHLSASVSIIPNESRTEPEQKALRGFHEELAGFDDLANLVERAKLAMGITPHGRAFARDILRIEITGPDRPHLTIVDLPGLIHSETKNQTSADVELIKDVVKSYMKEPRCIILAVVSAKNDFANQVVLKLARDADTDGNRTLGVITKPDTLTPGSESEAMYVSLARNQEVEFRHGWHVLKNMDSEKSSPSLSDRDAEEAKFLNSGVWTELPLSSLGIDKLRGRLSKALLEQIASELPSLMNEIKDKYKSCRHRLEQLGDPRISPKEQQRYLFHLSQASQALVKASVGGNYNNRFFGDAKTDEGYQQRIRAIIQNLNEEFASELSNHGHYREIKTTGLSGTTVSTGSRSPIGISREHFIDHVQDLMRNTRGCELPGTFNPMIVWNAASRFLELVVLHTADASTAKALQHEVFKPAMEKIMIEIRDKTSELLVPHKNGHPITYNQDFTESLLKMRRDRLQVRPDELLRQVFGVSTLEPQHRLNGYYDLQTLAKSMAGIHELDIHRFAASDALDYLDAYYKVALKRFIDDVAVEVIEGKLVTALDSILSPLSVFEMPLDQVARIAGECEETRVEREQLTKQVKVLRNGLETCKRFAGFKITAGMNGDLLGA
ncbi:hypothetical protein BT67DRAFT_452580 [Trichocladium antarcticum]|uniref:Uncharacterized protein n=1 Tax=Trichocladium antarcticum TaxID=1450529 RepID=A0AAN6UCH9_9PEZI|nr:hypothetical protein BT67DRAFT_452580 [Trichocladium antarcticum]